MFRKRRRPTPEFKIPIPFNPVQGNFDSLNVEGVWPYCAMMQVAEEDKFDDFVLCRGFDPRYLKFIDYIPNRADAPGIAVAKPFGCRVEGNSAGKNTGKPKRYRIGEVYPAFLPTQGTADNDPHYVPPSPAGVKWRVGQNPGECSGRKYGGHPKCLSDSINILRDQNNHPIHWMFIHTETRFFKFHALEDLEGESCDACVRQMSGYQPHVSKIYDPYKMFKGMKADTKGIVVFQEGKYYIVSVENKSKHYRFQSLADIGSGTSVRACIQDMVGGNKHEEDINDPDNIFENMKKGTKGIVVFQNNKYWIIQAKCDPDAVEACECDPETEDCEEEELNCDCEPETEGEEDCECPYPPY